MVFTDTVTRMDTPTGHLASTSLWPACRLFRRFGCFVYPSPYYSKPAVYPGWIDIICLSRFSWQCSCCKWWAPSYHMRCIPRNLLMSSIEWLLSTFWASGCRLLFRFGTLCIVDTSNISSQSTANSTVIMPRWSCCLSLGLWPPSALSWGHCLDRMGILDSVYSVSWHSLTNHK